MLKVNKEVQGSVLVIKLDGSIDENVNFPELVGPVQAQEVHVNCKGIPRINSVGVKAWIKFFQGLADKGAKLVFKECSTAIVEQMNLISNFSCGGEVESIYVPFTCQGCGAELVGLFKTEALKASKFEIPNLKCTKCATASAEFDDIPEEYFHFLMD